MEKNRFNTRKLKTTRDLDTSEKPLICIPTSHLSRICVKRWRLGGAMGTAWGLENSGRAEALYEVRQDTVVVGVAGGHAPSDRHGAGCADRVRFRGRPAACGGR